MTLEDENNEAFERMLDERESQDKVDENRYRYFEDLYNNQYRWWTHKQKDGKFKAEILTFKSVGGWARYNSRQVRKFRKRKDAKAWCVSRYIRAKVHQKEVLGRRATRKQERLDSKPRYTKEESSLMDSRKQIEHYKKLIKRANSKIKHTETRIHTYEKRIKVMQKRIEKVNQIAV